MIGWNGFTWIKLWKKIGIDEKWRRLIMQCVTTVSYCIRINGVPRGNIFPSRSISQRDPLSPYVFILCAEGLSPLIKSSVANGILEGVSVCHGGPKLSHLFFANDSLIFCKASLEECDTLQQILKVYEDASGQQLNRAKNPYFLAETHLMISKRRYRKGMELK